LTRPKLCVTDSVKNAPVFLRLLFLVVEIDRLVVIAEIFTHVPVSHDGAFAMRVVDGIDLLFPKAGIVAHVATFPLVEIVASAHQLVLISTLVWHRSANGLVVPACGMHFGEGPATAVF